MLLSLRNLCAYLCLLPTLLVGIATSCSHAPRNVDAGRADTLHYAQWLAIERYEGFTLVTVRNPWQPEAALQRYVLVPKSDSLPTALPEATLVRTPVERAVMHNAVHARLAYDLGVGRRVAGLCDVDYVVGEQLRSALSEGRLHDAGSSVNFNMERCVALRSEAVFTSPLQDVSTDVLRAVGIPVVECADYMEPHPLGRAEWMKFFGLLFDCSQVADSLYAAVEAEYQALAAQAVGRAERPRLMLDLPQGGTWYVPGGRSYLGILLRDAGADYAFAADAHAGSIALGRERGLLEARRADVWLIRHATPTNPTYRSLKSDDPLFATFRPWKEHRIFVCNTLRSDFFERIPFQPHVLLRELVALFREEGAGPASDAYFQPLEE